MSRVQETILPVGSPSKLPGVVHATAWVSFLTDLATELVYAIFPVFYAGTLHLSQLWMGLIEGTAEMIASLTKLLSGHWSDRTGGRKWWMVGGYSLSGLAKPLMPMAGLFAGPAGVLALRGADRLGKGIRGTPRDAIVSRAVSRDQRGRAFGYQRAMDHAGAMLGSLTAAAILWFGLISVEHLEGFFWWTLLPSSLAVLAIVLFVRDPLGDQAAGAANTAAAPLTLGHALRDQSSLMKRYLLVLAVFSLGNSTDALLLLRAREQMLTAGVSPQRAAALMLLLWSWLHVVKSWSSTWGGSLSDKLGRVKLLKAGWLVYAAVYAGFALWTGVVAPWVLFAAYGMFFGLTEGPERALVADLCPDPSRRGAAFGVYHFVLGISALPASVLCGGLWYFGTTLLGKTPWGAPWGPILAFGTGGALALVAAAMLPRTLEPAAHPV